MNPKPTIVLFDLDYTLIRSDSDYLFGEYLCQKKMVDVADYRAKNKAFFEAYHRNEMDVDAYLKFCLGVLKKIEMQTLIAFRDEFLEECIKPITSRKMKEIIAWHKSQKHFCIIITATHDFITRPIADLFGIEHLIATRAQILNGQFTGDYHKPACFQRNKITLFEKFLKEQNLVAQDIYGYSDSINDLPLLQYVDYPTAVNPDDKLRRIANQNDWKILDWL